MRSRPSSNPPTTRRAVLRAALGLAGIGALGTLTGCEVLGGGDLPPPPDELAGFLTSTIALGNRYDQVIKAVPELADRLEPIRDAHRAHVQALAAAVGVDVPTPDTGRPTPPEGPEEAVAESLKWVLPNEEVEILYVDDAPSDVQVPSAVEMSVAETEPGLRGDTASGGGDKPATLESGVVVRVPLFVNVGDRVRVDTRSGEYVSRA